MSKSGTATPSGARTPSGRRTPEYDPLPPMWAPLPFRTTYIDHAFPQHQYPLETTRRSISRGMSQIGHALHSTYDKTPDIHTPRADTQETADRYYVDVELPGIGDRKQIKLEWISSRTLYLETKIERKTVEEEEGLKTDDKKERKRVVVTTHKERHLGNCARAFHFPTAVEHATTKAYLENGLLRLTVPKVPDAPVKDEHKTVEVEHD